MGPKPRLGIHRYIFVLFEQKAAIGDHMIQLEPLLVSSSSRSHFSTRAFAHHFDLGLPVSAVFFNSHKERPLKYKKR